MSEQKLNGRILSIAVDNEGPSKTERGALELKIAELTGAAEYLSETISLSQGHAERLEKDVEDIQRHKQQAEVELKAQEVLNGNMSREIHRLEMEIKKNEATISSQQERVRIMAETIDRAERRSKQAIEAFHDETDSKLKSIKHEYEAERERYTIDLETHRNQSLAEMKQLNEELDMSRRKQLRSFELEYQDMKSSVR